MCRLNAGSADAPLHRAVALSATASHDREICLTSIGNICRIGSPARPRHRVRSAAIANFGGIPEMRGIVYLAAAASLTVSLSQRSSAAEHDNMTSTTPRHVSTDEPARERAGGSDHQKTCKLD